MTEVFEYALVRVVPRVERGEAINVGVIVYSQAYRYLCARIELDEPRLLAVDPGARTVPYMLSGGTDAKAFERLGIRCFGFAPLRLPPDLDFAALFHGIDERVPVDALRFGTEVLAHFLTHC